MSAAAADREAAIDAYVAEILAGAPPCPRTAAPSSPSCCAPCGFVPSVRRLVMPRDRGLR